MKKFGDVYGGEDFKRFCSDENDIVVFDYRPGRSTVFLRTSKDKHHRALVGSCKSAHSKNVDGERYQTAHYKLKDDGKELELYIAGKRAALVGLFRDPDLELTNFARSPMDLPFEDLPDLRTIEYLGKIHNHGAVLITCPVHNYSYDKLKCYRVDHSGCFEEKILDFQRYRDGGTTTFITDKGNKFYRPSSFKKDGIHKWNNVPMEPVPQEKWADDIPKAIEALGLVLDEVEEA